MKGQTYKQITTRRKHLAIDHDEDKFTPKGKVLNGASGRTTIPDDLLVDVGPIIVAEITRSIKKMTNNRSPGPGGIPVQFLK